MSVFLVSYDARAPGRNYQQLYDMLKKVDGVRALESVWLIDVNQTATTVRDNVKSWLDANDGVLVIEITTSAQWAFVNLLGVSGAWLSRKRP